MTERNHQYSADSHTVLLCGAQDANAMLYVTLCTLHFICDSCTFYFLLVAEHFTPYTVYNIVYRDVRSSGAQRKLTPAARKGWLQQPHLEA